MITVTLTDPRHIAGVTAAWLAVPEADRPATLAEYAQDRYEKLAESWAEVHAVGIIQVAAFVRRFPGAVMDAVNASTDPTVALILAQLNAVQMVRLWHPTTTQGVAYLVGAGYMTQAQADAVLEW